jgi:hypothetical protein
MDELLSSIVPKATLEERRGLARVIPGLLKRLKTGVTGAGIEDAVSSAFFVELMKVHTEIMQTKVVAPVAATPTPTTAAEIAAAAKASVKVEAESRNREAEAAKAVAEEQARQAPHPPRNPRRPWSTSSTSRARRDQQSVRRRQGPRLPPGDLDFRLPTTQNSVRHRRGHEAEAGSRQRRKRVTRRPQRARRKPNVQRKRSSARRFACPLR